MPRNIALTLLVTSLAIVLAWFSWSIALDGLAPARGFRMVAIAGERQWEMGDAVPLLESLQILVEVPFGPAEIVFLRDGEEVTRIRVDLFPVR